MAKAQKIWRRESSAAVRRWEKKHLRRLRRRAEKRNPENAGTRIRDFTKGSTA